MTFKRPPGCPPACDPRLNSLQIECCGTPGVGGPPTVTLDGPFYVPPPSMAMLVAPQGGAAGVPVTVSGIVTDPDRDPVTARWSVDGVDVGAAVLDPQGNTSLTRNYADGVHEVALTATDGVNVTTAKTTVMIGDHAAPVVTCPSGPPIVNGQIVVRLFTTTVPDLVSGTTATDNETPAPALFLSQDPPAGTPVQQGTYPIVVTATDEAGNSGTCTVHLRVQPVVAIVTPVKYQIFPPMTLIQVTVNHFIPPAEVVQTIILLDGLPLPPIAGPLSGPFNLPPLPVGVHTVQVQVMNIGGVSSVSEEILFEVK